MIVVNDGSTDGSEAIIDDFCRKYDCFVKINKENSGVSASRNLGIDTAKGEYIAFVDADDKVATSAFSAVTAIMEKKGLDAFYFSYSQDEKSIYNEITKEKILENCDFMSKKLTGFVWTGIRKMTIIKGNGLRFNEELKYAEDSLFDLQFSYYTSKVGYTTERLYYYRNNDSSATNLIVSANSSNIFEIKNSNLYQYLLGCSVLHRALREYGKINNVEKRDLFESQLNLMRYGVINKSATIEIIKDMKKWDLRFSDVPIKTQGSISIGEKILRVCFKTKITYIIFCYLYIFKGKILK